jgi:hypothetical protein
MAGLTCTIALLLFWLLSVFYGAGAVWERPDGYILIGFASGVCDWVRVYMSPNYYSMGFCKGEVDEWRKLSARHWIGGSWRSKHICSSWLPQHTFQLTDPDLSRRRRQVLLPIWIPLSLVALPTLYSFWHARKRKKPGLCQVCLYDLTGNVSGICPECGSPIPDAIRSEVK